MERTGCLLNGQISASQSEITHCDFCHYNASSRITTHPGWKKKRKITTGGLAAISILYHTFAQHTQTNWFTRRYVCFTNRPVATLSHSLVIRPELLKAACTSLSLTCWQSRLISAIHSNNSAVNPHLWHLVFRGRKRRVSPTVTCFWIFSNKNTELELKPRFQVGMLCET